MQYNIFEKIHTPKISLLWQTIRDIIFDGHMKCAAWAETWIVHGLYSAVRGRIHESCSQHTHTHVHMCTQIEVRERTRDYF